MSDAPDRLVAALADRYRIERELGEGGMATVYLAEDLKHHRQVAIKVLKPDLAAVLGADRFVQEIATTASLQHPNILPLFDSGTADGFLYYVMPYVEGESLRDRLNREKQLPVQEAVDLTSEIADALDYAHEHGVVHRDIKPENILIHAGRPMVADFGIALAVSAAAGGRMTETGLSLGTPHYMSPEQATAEPDITGRSDIYSLASVLYEMLTGEPPHLGGSAQQIIMKIVTEEPAPITKLRKSVPPNVAAAVAKALEKLPADRFGSVKAFADALADPGYRSKAASTEASVFGARRWGTGVTLVGWLLWGLTLAVGGWLWSRTRSGPQEPVRRYALQMSEPEAVTTGGLGVLALSPDGSRIAYIGGGATGPKQIWIRNRDQLHARPVPGTEGARDLSWSPDGRRLAFQTAPGALKVVALDGALPTVVTDSLSAAGGGTAWAPDGVVYSAGGFGSLGGAGIVSVPVTGGAPTVRTRLDTARHEFAHVDPAVLPNDRGLLFSIWYGPTRPNDTEIAVLDLKTDKYRVLQAGLRALYLTTGDLLIARANGSLVAVPFDQDKLEVTGPAVPMITGVAADAGYVVNYDVSDAGTLVYYAGEPRNVKETVRPVWVTRGGVATPVDSGWTFDRPFNGGMSLSPDGRRLAVAIAGRPNSEIWIKQLDREHGPLSRLTFEDFLKYRPSWSPDGGSLAYLVDPGNNNASIYERRADFSGKAKKLLGSNKALAEALWSPDGHWMVVRTTLPTRDLYAFQPGVDTTLTPIVTSPQFDERAATLSPDGRWIAYQSDESGRDEIYVRPFPGAEGGRRWQVSAAGGSEPLWSHSGREIFYRAGSGEMMAVPVTTTPTFAPGTPHALFPAGQYASGPSYRAYDISPDDRRFLMLSPVSDSAAAAPNRLVVVDHWFEELERKMQGTRGG
ncbi:MAG: protein kinase [Candidatus Palauibacterales bacterium]|nr:protein kinase [Candidatus Palauibacterales bacterium]